MMILARDVYFLFGCCGGAVDMVVVISFGGDGDGGLVLVVTVMCGCDSFVLMVAVNVS
jgi:hypothetical protein